MVESVVDIKPGDSYVVIGYQVDEFTCTLLAECFIAQSHIYPGYMGKVSTLTHFPLEPSCEEHYFLDQVVKDFKHGLDSIIIDSIDTPELDAPIEEAGVMPSSVSSEFLHSISTVLIILDHSFLLASNFIIMVPG